MPDVVMNVQTQKGFPDLYVTSSFDWIANDPKPVMSWILCCTLHVPVLACYSSMYFFIALRGRDVHAKVLSLAPC